MQNTTTTTYAKSKILIENYLKKKADKILKKLVQDLLLRVVRLQT